MHVLAIHESSQRDGVGNEAQTVASICRDEAGGGEDRSRFEVAQTYKARVSKRYAASCKEAEALSFGSQEKRKSIWGKKREPVEAKGA